MEESDLAKCRRKIKNLLEKYNCEIISADEWTHTLIRDKATQETNSI